MPLVDNRFQAVKIVVASTKHKSLYRMGMYKFSKFLDGARVPARHFCEGD